MPPGIGYGRPENRNTSKFGMDAVRRRLQGITDPRGSTGIMSRGSNVYSGGLPAARTGGGPGIGRPRGAKDVNRPASVINRRRARMAGGMTPYGR